MAVATGDLAGASGMFDVSSRDGYTGIFQLMKDAGVLQEVASSMGEAVIDKQLEESAAFGHMNAVIDGEQRSFFILYIRDDDGIWRIKSF